jgi:hypothetical protein
MKFPLRSVALFYTHPTKILTRGTKERRKLRAGEHTFTSHVMRRNLLKYRKTSAILPLYRHSHMKEVKATSKVENIQFAMFISMRSHSNKRYTKDAYATKVEAVADSYFQLGDNLRFMR